MCEYACLQVQAYSFCKDTPNQPLLKGKSAALAYFYENFGKKQLEMYFSLSLLQPSFTHKFNINICQMNDIYQK